MKKSRLRIVAAVLAAVMLAAVVGSVIVSPAFAAKTETQLQQELDRLEKEQKRLQNELNKLSKDKKKQAEYQKTLSKQISSVETQVDTLETQISSLNKKIEAKEKEIAVKTADIDENYNEMLERLAATQLAGENSMLTALMTAENFTDLLTRAEMIQAVAERDQALINKLAAEKRDIEAAKQEIEKSKKTVESSMKTLATKKKMLSASYEKSEAHMADIRKEEAAYKKDKAKIDAEEAEAQKELDDFYATHQSTGSLSPGGWLFPVVAKNLYISSKYGWRPSMGDNHKGVDISCSGGSHGKSIVASKSGTVIKTVKTSPSSGYGNYIIIDHGGNFSTLYAHCSQVLVNVGQTVKQGDVIGKVGNTGNSFGAHLHFEVRIGGKHQNPMNYIKLP